MMSDLMNLHGDVLSLSEFHTMVGPGLLRAPPMDGVELWKKFCFVSQRSKDLMRLAPCSEILADVSGGEPYPEPLELITIPHLAERHQVRGPVTIRKAFQRAVTAQPTAPTHEHFARIFNGLRGWFDRKCWVERSGATLDYLDLLLPCYPDTKLIHIYRDGRETALSMAAHPYFKIRAVYAMVDEPMSVEDALSYDLPITSFGHYWSRMVIKGMKTLTDEAHRTLHVSYELLLNSPESQLRRIFEFMELSVDDSYLNEACRSIHSPIQRRAGLAPHERLALTDACAPGELAIGVVTSG